MATIRFRRGIAVFFLTATIDLAPGDAAAAGSAPAASTAAKENQQALVDIEKRVDAGTFKIHGTILRVVYAPGVADDGYLVKIETSDRKSTVGQLIMIVQDQPGRRPGQPWPEAGKAAPIYCVGTSPYLTTTGESKIAPCYVPDRESAIIWAFSQ
jgi:hypothetical protein